MNKRALNILSGFALGVLLLHPLSMAFEGLIHPGPGIEIGNLMDVYNPHHLPMAFFFGLVGVVFVLLNLAYASRIARKEQRVSVLEGLLPICAYCKKIREADRPAEDRSAWHDMEHYLSLKAEASFTHGMCPDCYEKVMAKIDEEEAQEAACH
jgi:hypothetical protein